MKLMKNALAITLLVSSISMQAGWLDFVQPYAQATSNFFHKEVAKRGQPAARVLDTTKVGATLAAVAVWATGNGIISQLSLHW